MFFNGMINIKDFVAKISLDNHLTSSIKQFCELSQQKDETEMMTSLEKNYADFGQMNLEFLEKFGMLVIQKDQDNMYTPAIQVSQIFANELNIG